MDIDWGKVVSAISRSPYVIGAVGAILALRVVPGASPLDKFINVVGGSVVAGVGTPALAEWLGWTSIHIISFASLVIGLSAMTLVAEFLKAIKEIKWADIFSARINAWFASRDGKGKE